MKLLSVNTGGPREVQAGGSLVRTSIWKAPRDGRVVVRTLNLDGDEQSDLSAHGGTNKAVYIYPFEHYAYWREQMPGVDLPFGAFGENLTTGGLLERDVCIGDRLAIGTAEFQVTQPRQPCFKLGLRFGRDDMVKRFVASLRSGFYVAVTREGDVGAGDAVRIVHRASPSMSVHEIFALNFDEDGKAEHLQHAANIEGLSQGWRDNFRKRLEGSRR